MHESEDSSTPRLSGATSSVPTLKVPGQQAAAPPDLSALQSAWNSALSLVCAPQPTDGVKPAAALNGPDVAVAKGTAVKGDGSSVLSEAALIVSPTDLKILQVPKGYYVGYPGHALLGCPMYSILPPSQHAHVQHQLQVLLCMEHILRISGHCGHAEPVQLRVYHHVIAPCSQPPVAIAMESLFTLILTSEDQAACVLIQSRTTSIEPLFLLRQ